MTPLPTWVAITILFFLNASVYETLGHATHSALVSDSAEVTISAGGDEENDDARDGRYNTLRGLRADGNYLSSVNRTGMFPVRGLPEDINPRIIGGEEIAEDRYPFLVTIFKKYSSKAMYQMCGGSLIAPDVVLSAAHCINRVNHVHIGRHDLKDGTDYYEEFDIVETIMHPDFELSTFNNDFVLFKLSGESKFPTATLNKDADLPRRDAFLDVVGWGKTSNEEKTTSNLPFEASVKYQTNNECQKKYENERITDNMLCASNEGKDSCQGDSGGPLIMKGADASKDVVIGVVSWGYACADPDHPGVYSRISSAIGWIEEELCNMSPSRCAQILQPSPPSPGLFVSAPEPPTQAPSLSAAPTLSTTPPPTPAHTPKEAIDSSSDDASFLDPTDYLDLTSIKSDEQDEKFKFELDTAVKLVAFSAGLVAITTLSVLAVLRIPCRSRRCTNKDSPGDEVEAEIEDDFTDLPR